jgi:hypothetical protein
MKMITLKVIISKKVEKSAKKLGKSAKKVGEKVRKKHHVVVVFLSHLCCKILVSFFDMLSQIT